MDVASDSEKAHLKHSGKYTYNLLEERLATSIVNHIVWRRSALYVLTVLAVAVVIASLLSIGESVQKRRDHLQRAHFPASYEEWAKSHEPAKIPCSEVDVATNRFLKDELPRLATVLPFEVKKQYLDSPPTCASEPCGGSAAERMERFVKCKRSSGQCQIPGTGEAGAAWASFCPSHCRSSRGLCEDPRAAQPDFRNFAESFTWALMARLSAEAAKVEIVKSCIKAVMSLAMLYLVILAAASWACWRRSYVLIMAAWLVNFATPFLPSMLPTRFLVDFRSIDLETYNFLREVRAHYGLSNEALMAKNTALRVCNMPFHELRDTWQDSSEQLCNLVRGLPSTEPIAARVRRAQSHCSRPTLEGLAELCLEVDALLAEDGQLESAFDLVKDGRAYARIGVEIALGAMSALSSLGDILPAALSLGPGLLRGAVHAKTIVPEAAIPGTFVVLLPWLYAPMTWALYNLLLQITGSVYLLCALLLLAFAPLVTSMLGARSAVNSPMTLATMLRFRKIYKVWTRGWPVLEILLLICFAADAARTVEHRHEGVLSDATAAAMRQLLEREYRWGAVVLAVVRTVIAYLFKFYLTATTSTDWMLSETAVHRQFENLCEQKSSLPLHCQEEAEAIVQGRTKRLNALVILNEGHDEGPSRFRKWIRDIGGDRV